MGVLPVKGLFSPRGTTFCSFCWDCSQIFSDRVANMLTNPKWSDMGPLISAEVFCRWGSPTLVYLHRFCVRNPGGRVFDSIRQEVQNDFPDLEEQISDIPHICRYLKTSVVRLKLYIYNILEFSSIYWEKRSVMFTLNFRWALSPTSFSLVLELHSLWDPRCRWLTSIFWISFLCQTHSSPRSFFCFTKSASSRFCSKLFLPRNLT